MALTNSDKRKFANEGAAFSNFLNAATAGALGVNTNAITLCTAGAFGGIVSDLVANSDDTAAVNAYIFIELSGGTIIPRGIVNIAASSGDLGTVANVDCFLGSGITLLGLRRDPTGKPFLYLPPLAILKASCKANMTAAKKCHFSGTLYDYAEDPTT